MQHRLQTKTAIALASYQRPVDGIKAATLRSSPMDHPAPEIWVCPDTGLVVPKEFAANLHWRQELRVRAAADEGFRRDVLAACGQSPLFWINGFVWTYRQKYVTPRGDEVPITGERCNTPMITWPVQDDAVLQMLDCIKNGEGVNMEKSRDMGVTWLVLELADWFFLFRTNVNIGAASRKEELVDKSGDMDTLFEKIRHINKNLPQWMLPDIKDRYMFMHNIENNSTIIGESTNVDVGRGGRKTFYVVDEAAAISRASGVEDSLSQNTACQIWVSTPHGPNTQFHKRITEKRGRLIQLPWYRHPEKAAGAVQIFDETGKVKWTSPWYRKLMDKYSKKTIAQEVDMDHGQAGDMFFDYTELDRHKKDHVAEPSAKGSLIVTKEMTEEQEMEMIQQMDYTRFMFLADHARCPWKFWFRLENGRPPQYWSYVFGIDVSNGVGASNSVITVVAKEISQVVAKFWDAYTSPEKLAVLTMRAGVWFGGIRPPAFIAWENNGPGGILGRKIVESSYPLFYRQRSDGSVRAERTMRWGWHSSKVKKIQLLGLYRDALSRDSLINPCEESMDEAADYIYSPAGLPIPSSLREETAGGIELHGDHVIADALAWMASQESPLRIESTTRAPAGSYAARREARQRKEKKRKSTWG